MNIQKLTREEFCVYKDKQSYLKNIDGHCIFFDFTKKFCSIYEFRPMGCRFYPMIFDIDRNTCILDNDCPNRQEFYKHAPIFQKQCKDLRKWIQQNLISD